MDTKDEFPRWIITTYMSSRSCFDEVLDNSMLFSVGPTRKKVMDPVKAVLKTDVELKSVCQVVWQPLLEISK